jgi:hypothetical protein
LTPLDPVLSVDRGYVLAAAGLLAGVDPDLSLAVLESELGKN